MLSIPGVHCPMCGDPSNVYDLHSLIANGQENKGADISGNATGFIENAILFGIKLNGYEVPGRHLGEFIGDIRAGGKCVVIENCCVDGDNNISIGISDSDSTVVPDVGCAYYVAVKEEEGILIINGQKIDLFNPLSPF
jgi:hypothetical protein